MQPQHETTESHCRYSNSKTCIQTSMYTNTLFGKNFFLGNQPKAGCGRLTGPTSNLTPTVSLVMHAHVYTRLH